MSLSARWLPPLLVVLAGTLATLPVLLVGIPFNNDLANHYHFALPFYDAITGGDLYPGWLATSNQGYGDPLFRFYPPGVYYLLVSARAVTGNWYTASALVFTFLSILGALGAYFWASCFLPRHTAAWAGVFYAVMPYRVAELYQAAQFAEFAGGVALLFAFAFTTRICQEAFGVRWQAKRDTALDSSLDVEQKRWRRFALPAHSKGWFNVAGLAASYALLILTHLPLTVLGSITLLLYGLLSLQGPHKVRTLIKLSGAAVLGLAASAFYWTTVVREMSWIVGDGNHPDPLLDYRSNFIFSTFSPEKNLTIWWMNILMIVTLGMCIAAIFLLIRKRRLAPIPVALILVFTILMATALSKPLWAAIPGLRLAQHPFRWLAVMSVAAPILIAASVPTWWKTFHSKRRPIALVFAGLVLISVTFTVSQIIRPARYLSRSEFEDILKPLRESPSIVQWLPVSANNAAQGKASYEKIPPLRTSAEVEAGTRHVNVTSWQALTRSFHVEGGERIDARIRTLYYPHWSATSNGQLLTTSADKDGVLMISVPEDATTINLEFREPTLTKVSVAVSIICWTLLAALFIFSTFKRMHGEPRNSS